MTRPSNASNRQPLASLLAAVGLLLVGCGGGGAGIGAKATSGYVPARVPIAWALRAFAIGGPSSALSAVATFDLASNTHANVSVEADRNAAPSAYQQTYTTSQMVQTGIESMQVLFYSGTGGQGSVVGSASASVLVKADGTLAQANGSPLGSIQATGTVASVSISGQQTLPLGSAEAVPVSVFDARNDLPAVSAGSVFLQIANGTGSATVNANGEIVGNSVGTITVTATVDGISSQPTTMTVSPPPMAMTSLVQATSALAVDPSTGNVWATVPATDPTSGNSVIEVDPSTRKIVSTIFVGSSPTVMAFSDDGTALYVGLAGSNSYARVDPVGKKLVATYMLGSTGFGGSQYPASIAVQPGNPNVVALCQQDDDDSGYTGGCIYNNGVLLANNMGIYNGEVLGFSTANTLWGSDPGSSPQTLYEGTVTSTGATLTNTNRALGGMFSVIGGNLYFTDGQVVSGTSGDLLGTYPVQNAGFGVALDSTSQTAYIIEGQYGGGILQLSSFGAANFRLIATYGVPTGPAAVNSFSMPNPGQFVFADGAKVYFLQLPPTSNARTRTRQAKP